MLSAVIFSIPLVTTDRLLKLELLAPEDQFHHPLEALLPGQDRVITGDV